MNFQVWGKTGTKLYGPTTGDDYDDNQLRFSLFCQVLYRILSIFSVSVIFSVENFYFQPEKIIIKLVFFSSDTRFNLGGGFTVLLASQIVRHHVIFIAVCHILIEYKKCM